MGAFLEDFVENWPLDFIHEFVFPHNTILCPHFVHVSSQWEMTW